MRLVFTLTQEIEEPQLIARAWLGKDAAGMLQCVIVEWSEKMKAICRSFCFGFRTKESALNSMQAKAVIDLLRFKLEAGQDIDGLEIEV